MPLVLCPTPIGNLEDVTLRVLRELAEADLVLCEDTRRTRILLDRHGISARLLSFHRHNEARRTDEVLPRLEAGERIAVASDAGLPGVNDPGAMLVSAALDRDLPVTVLPGPSAVETALVASGLLGERYIFLGYLPRTRSALDRLWQESQGWTWPAVAFESPRRLPASLASLAAADPERPVAVCRELTKRFEEVVRGAARGGRRAVRGGAQGRGHDRRRRRPRVGRSGRGRRVRGARGAPRLRRFAARGGRRRRAAHGRAAQQALPQLSLERSGVVGVDNVRSGLLVSSPLT